jgi:hypothetical protein
VDNALRRKPTINDTLDFDDPELINARMHRNPKTDPKVKYFLLERVIMMMEGEWLLRWL